MSPAFPRGRSGRCQEDDLRRTPPRVSDGWLEQVCGTPGATLGKSFGRCADVCVWCGWSGERVSARWEAWPRPTEHDRE